MPRSSKTPSKVPLTQFAGVLASNLASPHMIGVDVSLATLDVAYGDTVQTIANTRTAIRSWLKKLPAGCCLGLESTNTYHQLMADLAYEAGHTVYVLNPQEIKHYRIAIRKRAKTDIEDARLIARFLEAESAKLRAYEPLSPSLRRLHTLLHRRATIVKARTQLRLSLGKEAQELGLEVVWDGLLQQFKAVLDEIDKQMKGLLRQPEFKAHARRLRGITGLGLLSTSALMTALGRGTFTSSDALVCFFGLDPRPCDSGQKEGRRRMTKQGDGEVRRILFNAARAASQSPVWSDFYRRYRNRGLSDVQTLCILARKLIRVAWSVYKNETRFCAEKITALSA